MPANAAITTIGDDTPGRNEAPTSNRSDSSGIINPSLRVVAESLQNIEAQLSQLSRKTSDLQARLVASQYDRRPGLWKRAFMAKGKKPAVFL
ncbi:MAG: hypothetical protein M1817_002237 [Caeruleum heppii]|nr:MAG: hypothetical protein M1817_002237 [Caeruleum heppii]